MKKIISNMLPAMKNYLPVVLILSGLSVLLVSCNILSTNNKTDDCGPGIIVPGVCIDGVKLGDSREQVEELMGKPHSSGLADGLYRGWTTYYYKPDDTEGTGLNISFIYPTGPVDMFIGQKPYNGKTPEGIGIGSTLDDVKAAYGEPEDIPSDVIVDGAHHLQYTYCFHSTKFNIGMDDGVVVGFFMGYYETMEQDQTYQCK